MLFEYLKEHYDDGEPIFLDDIHIEGMRRDNFRQQIKTLADAGKIVRYEKGIYYIPKKTVLGYSSLSFESIIERKYISEDKKVFGYYSGNSLLNMIGLSTQVPNIPEITTNNEATRKRKVKIGKRYVIVRRSDIEINNDNVLYLQFLDIFRYADINQIKENKDKVASFFNENRLKFKKLIEYEKLVPMKLRKALRRSEIFDELAYR